MVPKLLAKQMSQPTGLVGRIVRKLMNRINAEHNAFALEQLGLAPGDRVLEIGFGGGICLSTLLKTAAFVGGVDRSSDVVTEAQRRFRHEVGEGRADFRAGTVEALPFSAGVFDKALSVNTVYFWASLDDGLAEIARSLRPQGRVVLGFLPKAHMDRRGFPPDIFTPHEPEGVAVALANGKFTDVRMRRPTPNTKWVVITALRAPQSP